MNYFSTLFLWLLALSDAALLSAQAEQCGTIFPVEMEVWWNAHEKSYRDFLQTFSLQNEKADGEIFRTIPVKLFVITRSDGTGALEEEVVNANLEVANESYQSMGIQFYACGGIEYIPNDEYYDDFDGGAEEDSLYNTYGIDGVINAFFTKDMPALGWTYLPPNEKSLIMMSYGGANDFTTFTHEMGHFFGLKHTHEGNDFADGSTCDTQGDLICDTPADPQLSAAVVNPDCIYIGTATDNHGDAYHPLTDNHMSYSRPYCRSKFTFEQYARMAYYAQTARDYLMGCPQQTVDFSAEYEPGCDLPLQVQFYGEAPAALFYAWDFDGDQVTDDTAANPSFVYEQAGVYDVRLSVFDGTDSVSVKKKQFITAGAKSFPYREDFESFLKAYYDVYLEEWIHLPLRNGWTAYLAPADYTYFHFGWRLEKAYNSSVETDHSRGDAQGHFMFLNPWDTATGDTAILTSPCLDIPQNAGHPTVSFWYFIAGPLMNTTLHVDLHDGTNWIEDVIPAFTGAQQASLDEPWRQASFSVANYAGQAIHVRFRCYKTGGEGYIAIDDFLCWEYATLTSIGWEVGVSSFQELSAVDSCRAFTDYPVYFLMNDTVREAPAVLHLAATGTATEGRDFELPSTELMLEPGAAGRDSFMLRIYNDRSVEEEKTVNLLLTLTGSSNAVLTDSLLIIRIENDDVHPDPAGKYGTYVLLDEDFSNPAGLPVGWSKTHEPPSQGWKTGFSVDITGPLFPISGNTTRVAGTNNLGCNCEAYYDYLVSPMLDFSGLRTVMLQFQSYGKAFNNPGFYVEISTESSEGPWQKVYRMFPNNEWRWYNVDLSEYAGENQVWVAFHYRSQFFAGTFWMVDNIKVAGIGAAMQIAVELNQQDHATLGPYETAHFLAADSSSLLASVENLGGWDYGCIEAVIDRSGNLAVPFQNNTVKDMLASKTIFIAAENTNPDSTFRLTLYYTAEEISNWETATGNMKEQLGLVRSPGEISQVTPVNPFINGANDLGVSSINGDYGMGAGFYVSGTFQGHFGGFGVGAGLGEPTPAYAVCYINEFAVLPNPCKDQVTITIISPGLSFPAEVTFFDAIGQKRLSKTLFTASTTIDVSQLQPGVYFIEIKNKEKWASATCLIKL